MLKKFFILGGIFLFISFSPGDSLLDTTKGDGTIPRLPQPGEFSIWDDGTAEEGWTWIYHICDHLYDGWGKLCLANQSWAFGQDLVIEGISAFEMCYSYEPEPPVTGFYEDWAICAVDPDYPEWPEDFFNGTPWARETFPTTTNTPGTWNTYEFSQPVYELGVDEEFWAIVVILQDHWTPGGYNAVYYGYDTNNWYSRSYFSASWYYDFDLSKYIIGEGEFLIRVYGDIDTTIEQTSLGQIKSLFNE